MGFPGCRCTAPGCTGICHQEGLTMSELTGLHLQIDELDEYEQYLLTALLKRGSDRVAAITANFSSLHLYA